MESCRHVFCDGLGAEEPRPGAIAFAVAGPVAFGYSFILEEG